jgi:hypothetical protein
VPPYELWEEVALKVTDKVSHDVRTAARVGKKKTVKNLIFSEKFDIINIEKEKEMRNPKKSEVTN